MQLPGGSGRTAAVNRLVSTACAGALLAITACTDSIPTTPTADVRKLDTVLVRTSWTDAGVLSSSPDTCPWYTIPPELWDPYVVESEEPASNPDSVEASYGINAENPDYYAPLLVLDPATGAELYAGPCEVSRNRCWAKCRKLPAFDKRLRALCWGGCMAAYALCKARERALAPPAAGGCSSGCETQIIYDPETCDADSGGCSGGGGGGDDGGGGSNCTVQWIVIEVNDGSGWRTWWEGYATVCG